MFGRTFLSPKRNEAVRTTTENARETEVARDLVDLGANAAPEVRRSFTSRSTERYGVSSCLL